MNNILKGALIVLFGATLMLSCKEDDSCKLSPNLSGINEDQLKVDTDSIDSFLAQEGITATIDPSGLRYVIHEQGSGGKPVLCDWVTVKYVGTLHDGREFDSSKGEEVNFRLNGLILGWQVGFSGFNTGTKATLYVPSQMAYGPSPRSGSIIGANENLIFEVELIRAF